MSRILKILIMTILLNPVVVLPALAAEVALEPSNPLVTVGSKFSIDITISLDPATGEQLAGGVIDLGYDDSVVEIVSVTIDPGWDFMPDPGSKAGTGLWEGIGFDVFDNPAVTADAIIATVTLEARGAGASALSILPSSQFFSTTVRISPTITSASITVNTAPVANNQALTTDEDIAVAITLTGSDVESDPLSFTVATGPTNGSLSGAAPNLTYTPNAGFSGSDGFTFTANDGFSDSNTATVSITVNTVIEVPIPAPEIDVTPLTVPFGPVALGQSGTATVTISNPGTADLNVSGSTIGGKTEFTVNPAGPLVVPAGDTQTLTVTYTPTAVGIDHTGLKIASDDAVEPVVTVSLTGEGVPASVPSISIDDVSVRESDKYAVFRVTLSSPSDEKITIHYSTRGDTATPRQDYESTSKKLKFRAGETQQIIKVRIKNDKVLEPDETYYVDLDKVSGAVIGDGLGMGTILDDEICLGPNLLVNPGAETEPIGDELADWNVTQGIGWEERYHDSGSDDGTGYFSAVSEGTAELRQDIDVSAYADRINEGNQAFAFVGYVRTFDEDADGSARIVVEYRNQDNDVVLDSFDSGTISSASEWKLVAAEMIAPPDTGWIRVRLIVPDESDDIAAYFDDLTLQSVRTPVLTVDGTTVKEKDYGTGKAKFKVRLSCAVDGDVTFDYETRDHTAAAPGDYEAILPTSLTFPGKKKHVEIPLKVMGDIEPEEDESFFLHLTNATNAVILDVDSIGLIIDNDCPWGDLDYWKKQDVWPVDELLIGDIVYTREDALMDFPDYHGNNKLLPLIRELMATKLNLAAGSDPVIIPAVEAADAFLVGSSHDRRTKQKAHSYLIEKKLRSYNHSVCRIPDDDDYDDDYDDDHKDGDHKNGDGDPIDDDYSDDDEEEEEEDDEKKKNKDCLLYTSPSPRD